VGVVLAKIFKDLIEDHYDGFFIGPIPTCAVELQRRVKL